MRGLAAVVIAGACAAPPAPTLAHESQLVHASRDEIRAHAWALWQRLADRATPAWDAWEPTERLFYRGTQPPALARPRFRTPRPFRNGERLEHETLPVMFDVVFDPSAAAHIRAHRLGSRTQLAQLATLPAFPRDATAVKLVWYAVRARGLTAMPIWDDTPTRADADGNPDDSWQRAVAVDPSRSTIPAGETARVELAGRTVAAHVVPLDAFVHRELATDEELATARAATHDPQLARGDHVALVAVHLTTKEIPDWTWETYWWHDHPDDGRFAAGRPALHGAAANYVMDATFGTDGPCFNPWLEARFPDGMRSNCVTCHQRAVIGADDYLPITTGRLHDDDPYFAGRATTDFVWSIVFEAR